MALKDSEKRNAYHRAWVAKWRAANPEVAKEVLRLRAAKWRARHPDYAKTPEARKAAADRNRAWRKANPELAKEKWRRDRAKAYAADPAKERQYKQQWY